MEATCGHYHELMDEALDDSLELGLPPPGALRDHLTACADCDRDWRRLAALHGMLIAQDPILAPANFTSRTMARLDAWSRSRPAWQMAMLQLGAIVAGVAALMALISLFRTGQGAPMSAALWVATGAEILRYAGSVAGALVAALAESPWVTLSYPLIVVMLAAMWFLALFGPRLVFKPGRDGPS